MLSSAVVAVTPSIMFNSVAVAVTPSSIFNSAAVEVRAVLPRVNVPPTVKAPDTSTTVAAFKSIVFSPSILKTPSADWWI